MVRDDDAVNADLGVSLSVFNGHNALDHQLAGPGGAAPVDLTQRVTGPVLPRADDVAAGPDDVRVLLPSETVIEMLPPLSG